MWRKRFLLSVCALWRFVLPAGSAQAQVLSESSAALIQAVLSQDLAGVQAALEQGVNANSRDEQGIPALTLAVSRENADIVRVLLTQGADVHAKARSSEEDVHGIPVIWFAAANGTGEIVRLLLQAGADPNARGGEAFTPLMVAAAMGNTATLEVLIAAKADLEARGQSDETALMAAANAGRYEATRLLLDAGAEINALGELKATPLIYAAQHGFDDVVALLIERGADLKIKAAPGLTALDLAKQNGHQMTILLLENGGRPQPPVASFETFRVLLYPESPIERSFLYAPMQQEALETARQKILKGELQQARDLLEVERERVQRVQEVTDYDYRWILFYVQQQLGDRVSALESLRQILGRPGLSSREALRAWKLMRDLGDGPSPASSKQILAVVVEMGLGPAVVVVAATADGQPRFFASPGAGLIGENWKEPEIRSNGEVVRLAQDLVEGMAPGEEQAPPLPKPGRVRFTLLTPGGAYTAEDSAALMAKGEGRYAQLYSAAHDLFSSLSQRYEAEGSKNEAAPE